MTLDPLHSDAPLIVYVDVKSPYAFVALGPTLALERELSLRFDWRPLTLDIGSYLGTARKAEGSVVESTGRSEALWRGIRYSYGDARRYAERQGLVLKGTEKIWDTRRVNIALLWVARHHRDCLGDFMTGVFAPFWRRELDVEDPAVIDASLAAVGIDASPFDAYVQGEGGELHDALQPALRDAGIFGVPTYVIDGEMFFGREHIPYLRWRLRGGEEGGQGPAPDIAYEVTPC